MNQIQINFADFVQIQAAQPVTTSKFVAEAFGKRHDDVLRKIREILAQVPDYFHKRNFAEMETETEIGFGNVRKDKAYQLTKDGFMLLVMGFTGKAAMQIKIAYIEAFNAMADKLKQLAEPAETKISPAQKQQIRQAVQQRHHRTGEHWQDIYRKLHNLLQVNSYHEITAEQFQTAMAFLRSIRNTPAMPKDKPAPQPEYINGRRVLFRSEICFKQFDEKPETYLITLQRGKISEIKSFKPSNAVLEQV